MGIWDGTQPLRTGVQDLCIIKVKNSFGGKPITQKDGNPAIKVVFQGDGDTESECHYALGGKMVWKFAQLLTACGHDPNALTEVNNIRPEHFHMDAICNQYLVGFTITGDVTERVATDGKTYQDVKPLPKKKGEAGDAPAAKLDDDGSVPF